jgi:uncharacterized protein (DUF302 family)
MKYLFYFIIYSLLIAPLAVADDGMVHVKSNHNVKTTADRLENALKNKGMTIFNRINHAAGAQKVGLKLPPMELVIFGNPKVGSPLMQCSQTTGIDLPQKALIWQDESGSVWLSYNHPDHIGKRHRIEGCRENLKKVANALGNFAKAATMP